MLALLNKLLGDPNKRRIAKHWHTVDLVNQFEEEIAALSDDGLRAKTEWFKAELAQRPRDLQNTKADWKLQQEALEWILPEAFAVCREASKRALGMRHYDVQLVGGMILHNGGIAEMRTGEGKTLVATLPAYLNALTGRGVHVVTVNDYLARRDAEWMGILYQFLGLSVGVVTSGMEPLAKREAYKADITYGTNNEFGFDYLRDNMATSRGQMVQRPYHTAIVDEVDSILIDEARTPLIISGRLEQSADLYRHMATIAPQLVVDEDYTLDEKAKSVILTEEGIEHAEKLLGVEDLFDASTNLAHHLLQALKARTLFMCDKEYVVKDDQIVIVDEFTGRMMEGRRWGDGLHQAVEAKEGVSIQDETQTLASITYQNLFRLYPKLCGMTGTALTEEAEFSKIYNLTVAATPTNRVDLRKDEADVIYKSEQVKFLKVIEDLLDMHQEGRPVLVGTTSIDKSELISALLTQPAPMVAYLGRKATYLDKFLKDSEKSHPILASILANPANISAEQYEAAATDTALPKEVREYIGEMKKIRQAINLIEQGVPHQVLNAKHHEREAYIVAQAGRKGAITIATNMAGRGTDILLGGNPEFWVREELASAGVDWRSLPEDDYKALVADKKALTDSEKEAVIALGGLHIMGTERHESRRIDNQLRGRAARQGDPGSTKFYLSLEDSLMRIFGGQRVSAMMDMMQVDESLPIAAQLVSHVIESAQRKVEAYHFDVRKTVLRYDDVLTEQRALIYGQRKQVLDGIRLKQSMMHMLEMEMARLVATHLPLTRDITDADPEAVKDLVDQLHSLIPQVTDAVTTESLQGLTVPQVVELFQQEAQRAYEALETQVGEAASQLHVEHGIQLLGLDDDPAESLPEGTVLTDDEQQERLHPLRRVEREILLKTIDAQWIEYLHNLDALREGIGLRAYGQKDPLLEYKREAYDMFQNLTWAIQHEVLSLLFRSRIEIAIDMPAEFPPPEQPVMA